MYTILRIVIGRYLYGFGAWETSQSLSEFFIRGPGLSAFAFMRAEVLTAQVFPWIELIVGVFVLLGLWTSWALRGALVLFGIFVVVVGQALIIGLTLGELWLFW